jgi:hypothetical protein
VAGLNGALREGKVATGDRVDVRGCGRKKRIDVAAVGLARVALRASASVVTIGSRSRRSS